MSTAGALVSYSGRTPADLPDSHIHVSFSFGGLSVDWTWRGLPGTFVLRERGEVVLRTASLFGFPIAFKAPGTQGLVCIAKTARDAEPVVLLFVASGAGAFAELQVLYPDAAGRYGSRSFGTVDEAVPEIRVLGGSPAIILLDGRFGCLLIACAGTDAPVLVERVMGDHLVDVSDQFPSIIRADAQRLVAGTHQQWYKDDGVWSFIGELEGWVADECRLGNGSAA